MSGRAERGSELAGAESAPAQTSCAQRAWTGATPFKGDVAEPRSHRRYRKGIESSSRSLTSRDSQRFDGMFHAPNPSLACARRASWHRARSASTNVSVSRQLARLIAISRRAHCGAAGSQRGRLPGDRRARRPRGASCSWPRIRVARGRERVDRRHPRSRRTAREQVSEHSRLLAAVSRTTARLCARASIGARGEFAVTFDVDYYELEFVDQALALLESGDEAPVIVVASKRAPGSRDERRWPRRAVTAVFGWILHVGFSLSVSETHGMKMMRRAPIERLLRQCRFAVRSFRHGAGHPRRASRARSGGAAGPDRGASTLVYVDLAARAPDVGRPRRATAHALAGEARAQ